jgi:hypothetical protein
MKLSRIFVMAAHRLEATHWFVLSAIVFRSLLEISYLGFVSPIYSYMGFILDIDPLKYIESWVIYAGMVFIFPKRLGKASDYLMVYLLFAFLAPLLVFYGLANTSREHAYIVLLGVFLILFFRGRRPLRIPVLRDGKYIAYLLASLGVVVVTAWMIYSGGLKFFNLDFTRVYEFRREVGEVIRIGPMGYLVTWVTKVFGPVLLAIALWKKKYYIALMVCGLHVLWFGISSHKAVVFYPFLVTFIWMWFRNTKALAVVPVGMSLVIGFAYLLFILSSEVLAGSLLIRRVFFVPSNLTFAYYEFFSQNQFVFWSNSITSAFVDYPYELHPAELIGRYIGTDAHANNSFLATGYMHAGITGIAAYGVLVGLLFRIIDSLAHKGVPPWVAIASIIVPSQSLLVGADLPTAMLTHGIGMSLIILFLLRSAARSSLVDMTLVLRSRYRSESGYRHN